MNCQVSDLPRDVCNYAKYAKVPVVTNNADNLLCLRERFVNIREHK